MWEDNRIAFWIVKESGWPKNSIPEQIATHDNCTQEIYFSGLSLSKWVQSVFQNNTNKLKIDTNDHRALGFYSEIGPLSTIMSFTALVPATLIY